MNLQQKLRSVELRLNAVAEQLAQMAERNRPGKHSKPKPRQKDERILEAQRSYMAQVEKSNNRKAKKP